MRLRLERGLQKFFEKLLQNCLFDMYQGLTEDMVRHFTEKIENWDFANTKRRRGAAAVDIDGPSTVAIQCFALIKVSNAYFHCFSSVQNM